MAAPSGNKMPNGCHPARNDEDKPTSFVNSYRAYRVHVTKLWA